MSFMLDTSDDATLIRRGYWYSLLRIPPIFHKLYYLKNYIILQVISFHELFLYLFFEEFE